VPAATRLYADAGAVVKQGAVGLRSRRL
jgi:hypothetical protein